MAPQASEHSDVEMRGFPNKDLDLELSSPRPPDPMTSSSWWSWLTWSWPYPLLELGSTRALVETDLPDLPPRIQSSALSNSFEDAWNIERSKSKKPSLHRALLRHYWVSGMWWMHWVVAAEEVRWCERGVRASEASTKRMLGCGGRGCERSGSKRSGCERSGWCERSEHTDDASAGSQKGLSGGDPPNPPCGRRGRTCAQAAQPRTCSLSLDLGGAN
jgi:hypothetical protein